jgi:hypothetical protein
MVATSALFKETSDFGKFVKVLEKIKLRTPQKHVRHQIKAEDLRYIL